MYTGRLMLAAACMSASLLSFTAQAVEVAPCTEISWQPYQTYTIRSALHQRTHIILPEPIQGVPVPGSPQLWDVDGEHVHLFVKPKNFGNKEGGTTTVTAVSTTNTSYDFIVKRVTSKPDVCVRIVVDRQRPAGMSMGWQDSVERDNATLQRRLDFEKKKVAAQKVKTKEQVMDTLHAYRGQIYTRYSWKGGRSAFNANDITDVWDDGRWTYVRLNTDNKGLMQVTAKVNGKEELVHYDYDSDKLMYQLAGLYPEFMLRYDRAKVTVKREDSETAGAY